MKYLFFLLMLPCASCVSVKNVPTKGTYPTPPISQVTSTPVDSVWSNLIDYIAQKGMSIKVIDKSSWLLVTEDYDFENLYTTEKKDGTLKKPEAFIVVSFHRVGQMTIAPARVLGNWNVRLKPQGGGTLINVNLTNLRTYEVSTARGRREYDEVSYDVKTTGKFEQMIFDNIR